MKLSRKVCREGGVSMSKKICLAGSLLVLAAALCLAQTGASRISGTVTDSSGAVVPGVTVTAKNEATGVTHTQITTARGLYAFPALPVGSYTIIAELAGFKTTQKTGNILVVDTPLVVDVVLQVGGVSEVVNVEGGYEKLQSSNATLGNVVEQKAIVELPLNGRNPLTLITLEPGVVQRSYGGAGSGIHVNGSRDRAFNVTIDGIEANESSVPNPVSNLYRLNPDNVQEYKVTTNNATPEEGRNSGASVSVIDRNTPKLVDPKTGALRPGVRDCSGPADTNCVASFNMFANDPAHIGLDPKIGALFKSYPLPNNYAVGDGLNTASYQWNPP